MQALEKQEIRQSNIDFHRIRETQINNVLRLLRTSINRIKISLIIPKLASNLPRLRQRLKNTLYFPAVEILEGLHKLQNIRGVTKEILGIIVYFQDNSAMVEMFAHFVNNLPNEDKALLVAMETLYEVTRVHLNRTARSEIDMERQLHGTYHTLEEINASTAISQKRIRSRYAKLRWKQGIKFVLLNKTQTDLTELQWLNNDVLQKKINKIGRSLNEFRKDCGPKNAEVEEELHKANAINDRQAGNIAVREKEFRAEKNKLLIQLDFLIHKFDTTLCERMRYNLNLGDQLKHAKQELDAFMLIYRKEEAVYKRIVVEYEMEEKRKRELRILGFMMNFAARKIQRYWAIYRKAVLKRERKIEKMNEKKKKKKY